MPRISLLSWLAWGVVVAVGGMHADAALVDDVNGSETPGFNTYGLGGTGPGNIGWVYQPTISYTLNGIESTFRAAGEESEREVTLSIYDSLADAQAGNPALRSGTFSANFSGGNLGVMFSDLQITSGQDYFIAFSGDPGVDGLGLNIVDFDTSLPPPQPAPNPPFDRNPNIDFLNGWYTGANFETFNSLENSPGFSAPILRFEGSLAAVPEPASLTLCGAFIGLAGLMYRRKRRECRAGRPHSKQR